MRHLLAALGASAGLGIAMMAGGGLASAAVGLGLGTFLGYFAAGLVDARKNILKQSFAQLGNLRGRPLAEIVAVAGQCKSSQPCTLTDLDNAPGFLYTWQERDYMVTLLFDADNICIGVSKEIDGQQVLQ